MMNAARLLLQVLAVAFAAAWTVVPASAQSATGFDHFSTGFPLTGAHNGVDCASCHFNGRFRGTSRQCASCHNGTIAQGKFNQHPRTEQSLRAVPRHDRMEPGARGPCRNHEWLRDLPQRHRRGRQTRKSHRDERALRDLPQEHRELCGCELQSHRHYRGLRNLPQRRLGERPDDASAHPDRHAGMRKLPLQSGDLDQLQHESRRYGRRRVRILPQWLVHRRGYLGCAGQGAKPCRHDGCVFDLPHQHGGVDRRDIQPHRHQRGMRDLPQRRDSGRPHDTAAYSDRRRSNAAIATPIRRPSRPIR